MRTKKTSNVIIAETEEAMAAEGALLFSVTALSAIEKRGRFTVALSGGSTPRRMHRLIGQEPYLSSIPWNRVHLYWGDERCVPESSEWSNYGHAKEDFLDQLVVPKENIHPMPAHLPPEEGAFQYEKEIPEVLDLVFLGLGPDGHIASLFPGASSLEENGRQVMAVKGGDPDVPRLSITFSLINRARNVVFLVAGVKKSKIVRSVLVDHDTRFPATRVQPAARSLTWIMDREAASRLPGDMIGESHARK